MIKGILGLIVCPMLEDELLYSISKDQDICRIVLLENEHCGSIRKKMDQRGIKYETVLEKYFDEGRVPFDRSVYNIVIKMNNLGLHAEPADLKEHVTKQVRAIQDYVDVVGLYYGICGNHGWDITEYCRENGLKPAVIFRGDDGEICDDCVAVAIGGASNYRRFIKRYTGIFFLTPAIANNWEDFIMAGDLAKGIGSVPEDTLEALGIHGREDFMRWMFEIGHYEFMLKMNTGLDPNIDFDAKAEMIGKKLNLKPIEIEDGWITINTAEAIYRDCKKHLAIVNNCE